MQLTGLDAIPWHALTHAYGPADDVPALLCDLSADDAAKREAALGNLYSTIWHQGTIYEATAYAVPFLLAILKDPCAPDRQDLLELLKHLAQGTSFNAAHETLGIFAEQRQTIAWQVEKIREEYWVNQTYAAVAAGLDLYLELLDEPPPETQGQVIALLGALHGHQDTIIPVLLRRLRVVRAPLLRALIVRSLGSLGGARPDLGRMIVPWLERGQPAFVRFAAARALLCCAAAQGAERAQRIIEDALVFPERYTHPALNQSPFYESLALFASLDPQTAITIGAAALVRGPGERDHHETLLLAAALADIAWYGRMIARGVALARATCEFWDLDPAESARLQRIEGPTPGSFTAEQYQVMHILATHAPLWGGLTHNLLQLYDLPTDRVALRALAAPHDAG